MSVLLLGPAAFLVALGLAIALPRRAWVALLLAGVLALGVTVAIGQSRADDPGCRECTFTYGGREIAFLSAFGGYVFLAWVVGIAVGAVVRRVAREHPSR
jgi:hypothetical protein